MLPILKQPPQTKRKRYEQQQQHQIQQQQQPHLQEHIAPNYIPAGVESTTELIDLDSTQSYIINEFNSHASPSITDTNNASENQQHQSQHQNQLHRTTQHIITKDGLLYEQLDYDYTTPSVPLNPTPIKIESNELALPQSTPARATPKSTSRAAPQQHFKKKMQQQARSAATKTQPDLPIKAEVTDEQEQVVDTTTPQILAIIANPDDLEDLSHLDKPIVPEKRIHALNAKQSDYISSYCSFLENRTQK